jgi:hypothetical protein
MNTKYFATLGALSLALAGCGGGSSGGNNNQPPAGPQPTNITAAGKITGFGSIYVNGVKFETSGASYDIDDTIGSSDADVSVGMYVVVQGSVNADGVTGTADSVHYDDEVEGPVVGLGPHPTDTSKKLFFVLGTEVWIGTSTIFESEDGSAFGYDTIMEGDNVEVSGDYIDDVLHATYVELQDAGDDEYEAKGTVSAFNGSDTFTLTLDNGATLNITVAAGAEIPDGGIMDGQYVEVEGTLPDPVGFPNDLLAMKVELEDDDYFDDEDDEVEIKGPLSYNMDDESWSINTTLIVFGESTEYSPESLADAIADGSAHGRVVEVEGRYMDGALHADEVEDEEDDLEFKGAVSGVTATDAKNGTITLSFGGATGTLDVIVSGDTLYMDDDSVTPFDLTTLPLDTVVEIHAHRNDAGDVVASSLEIEDELQVEMEGPVDAVDDVSITILGITFGIDGTTMFFGAEPMVGDYAEVEDNDADGTANSIETDD